MKHPGRSAILLDLDDTLYDEQTYVRSGFAAVARYIAKANIQLSSESLLEKMLDELKNSGRGRVFNQVLNDYGVPHTQAYIDELIDVYRNHVPRIEIYAGAADVLDRLIQEFDVAIVTDGLSTMQLRKIQALRVSRWTNVVVYCWDLGAPKPRPEGYLEALRLLGHTISSCVIVGDNPDHDMAAAHQINVPSIRIRQGRFASVPDRSDANPVATIKKIDDLEWAIRSTLSPLISDCGIA